MSVRGAVRRWVLFGFAVVLALGLASVFAAENALRIHERPAPWAEAPKAIARQTRSHWETARVNAADGVLLDAWILTPDVWNGSAAILIHGVADTRGGVMDRARFLLTSGFMVLTPDVRGHGVSGGDLTTYGVREAGDVHSWADWLFANRKVERLYGVGFSMGAAILLESLAKEQRFRAMVAEAPFADFHEIAMDRMSQVSFAPRAAFLPIVNSGFLYARLRYGVDLRLASPAAAVRNTRIPILLIHGTEDHNIPIRHSRELRALNPSAIQLWEIPGADHMGAMNAEPEAYVRKVTGWLTSHR